MEEKNNRPEEKNEDTVYVLEGEPDEVYDAQGNRIQLTDQQKKEIEEQI